MIQRSAAVGPDNLLVGAMKVDTITHELLSGRLPGPIKYFWVTDINYAHYLFDRNRILFL